jgi:hypothetical protein
MEVVVCSVAIDSGEKPVKSPPVETKNPSGDRVEADTSAV